MKDKSFDKLLQEKLQGYEYPTVGPDWSRMQSALNQADKDVKVDSEIRNRLKEHEVPFEPSHWEILKEKLELERNLKQRIITSKIAEVVILFLLVFSAYQVKEYKGGLNPLVKKDVNSSAFNAFNKTANKTNTLLPALEKQISKDLQLDVNTQIIEKTESNTDVVFNQTVARNNSISYNKQNELTANSAVQSFESSAGETQVSKLIRVTALPIQNKVKAIPTIHLALPVFIRQAFNEKFKESNVDPSHYKENHGSQPTALRQTDENQLDELRSVVNIEALASSTVLTSLAVNDNQFIIPAVYDLGKAKKERWIGLISGVDLNFLKAPNFNSFKESTSELFELSASTGISYGFKKGANEFLMGASFSSKTFNPGLVDALEVTITNTDGEEEISLYDRSHTLEKYDIVSLPFQYRRHFNHDSKFHPYAFGGLSTNVVLFTDYEQKDDRRLGNARPKFYRDEVSQFQSEDFKEGIIEGGNYRDNLFLTAVLGVGFERKFNRTKVFAESQYTTNLFASTLGPRNVQLRSVSFSLGAKYRI
jgi:hypothetical protein